MGLRGLFSAISGLQNHSTWLDVVGNNLANVNTVAFKGSRVTFADRISQTLAGGSGPSTSSNLGGTNPLQTGLGSRIASIRTLFGQGPTLQTGNPFDVSLQGEGFLIGQYGNRTYLTRDGALHLDADGYLVDNNGGRIQGFMARTQYRRTDINSISSQPGATLAATNARMVVETSNPTEIGPIRVQPGMTIPPRATTAIYFRGNLDAFHQNTEAGGVVNLAPNWRPTLPVGGVIMLMGPGIAMDGTRVTAVPMGAGGGFALQQLGNLSAMYPGTSLAAPIINGGMNLGYVQLLAGNYAWEQQPPNPPAHEVVAPVYDSLGNPREITIQFYQVMDLGSAGFNSSDGPCQVMYAWYAFDTTGGANPTTANLIGGTGISEGDYELNYFDRGTDRDLYIGDFLYFNTDGSLANSGCAGGPVPTPPGPPNYMIPPKIYLPPYNVDPPAGPIPTMGSEIGAIELHFGTYGFITDGRRDGVYSDAAGRYEIIAGVSQYIPNHSVYVESQDGYPEGYVQDVTIDEMGVLKGAATNGQIVDLARLVMARVDNSEGLLRDGNGTYSPSNNSGSVFIGLPGQDGLAKIQSFSLEGSNVETAVELSNMIVAQKGLEANSRVVSNESRNVAVLTNMGR